MRPITSATLLRCCLSGLLLMAATATHAADLEAWIDKEVRDGVLTATPKVKVQNAQTISFELSAQNKGTSGTSSTRQAGTRNVACCDAVLLSTLRLNVSPADTCTLSLIVKVGEEVVAKVEEKCVGKQ